MNNQEAWPTKGQRLSEPNNIPIIREGNFLKIDSFLGKTQGDRKANEGLKTNKDPVHPEKKSCPNETLLLKDLHDQPRYWPKEVYTPRKLYKFPVSY